MLNLPIVKFEKSCNYLNDQLTLQNNNKQLILDIISNIGLILNESNEKAEQYDSILEKANEFLKSLSANITSIEQLNVEIKNITAELTSLLSEQNKASKTKEFYIAAFSNIKHNIIVYSKKFQELESLLTKDNNLFNEFINENNFKYNFVSIDDSTNTYTFTGFSMNDTEELSNDNVEIPVDSTTELEEIENTEDIEENINNEIEDASVDSTSDDEVYIEEADLEAELMAELEDEIVAELEAELESELENDLDTNLEESELEVENEIEFQPEAEEIIPENINKIEELTNEFKTLLLNISENNINDATSSVVSLFKELLPKDTSTSFEDFLDLENNSNEIQEETIEETEVTEFNLNAFDSLKIVEDFIIKDLENIIYEEHSGLIYEYDIENDEFSSYKQLVEEELENTPIDISEITEDIVNVTEDIIENIEESIEIIEPISDTIEFTNIQENTVEEKTLEEPVTQLEEVSENSDILLLDALLDNSEYMSTESILEKLEKLENIEEFNLSNNSNETENDVENIEESNEISETIENTPTSDLENNDELFVEDLDDVNEEVEDANDIEILIDNIETVENVEKSIFEELNNSASFLSDISFDGILENSEFNFTSDASIFEDILDKEILDELEENDIQDDNLISEDILDDAILTDKLDENISDTSIINEDIIDEDIISEIISDDSVEEQLLNTTGIDDLDIDISDSELIEQEMFELDTNKISLDDIDLNDIDIVSLEKNVEVSDDISSEENIVNQSVQEEEKNIEHFYKDDNADAEYKNKGLSKKDFDEKLLKIENALEDNKTLVISERLQKIYLPYKVSELKNYIENYPGSYNSLKDVVSQEFILPFDYFRKHPTKARFTEAYNLLKNREGRNFMKSVSYAFRLLNKNNLNPAIIASCKTQHELDSYLYYLDSDNLNNFKFFDIIYEVNPM